MKINTNRKLDAALRLVVELGKPELLQAIVQGRDGLYSALKAAGFHWIRAEQCWKNAPPPTSKFVDEHGITTGRFGVRIVAAPDLMHVVSEGIERSLKRKGATILSSSNFVHSKKSPVVYVFITARWPEEGEDTE